MADKRYIKSQSTYLKKSFHQNVTDGVIYERDWVTIGGKDKFLPNETPLYQNGNFVITVNNDPSVQKEFNGVGYEKLNGTEEWTLEGIENAEKKESDAETANNQIKNTIYDLRDFAYFGSCEELIRGSINSILTKFPGELYCTDRTVYYLKDGSPTQLNIDDYQYAVSNPFNINMHLINIASSEASLKYFAKEGYKNYQIIIGDENGKENSVNDVTSWTVSTESGCTEDGIAIISQNITLNGTLSFKYVKCEGKYYYLCKSSDIGKHIRPKKEFLETFFDELEDFEKVLLNRNSTPKYTAKFNVISDNDYRYGTTCQSFTFPTSDGGYNVGGSSDTLIPYATQLINIAEFYDERFSDNIYRMLTHETLKNFDFTIYKEDPNAENYEEGQDKLRKLLRLYGREFDKFKSDIEEIKDKSVYSYDEMSKKQAELLDRTLETEGYDAVDIFPYIISGTSENGCIGFGQDTASLYTPYKDTYGYYYVGKGAIQEVIPYSDNDYNVSSDCVSTVFKKMHSDNTCNPKYISTEFKKRLKVNSRYLLRKKGSAYGLESILALFGLKSDRMISRMDEEVKQRLKINDDDYDYTISETIIENINPISGTELDNIRKYNSYKTFDYDEYDETNQFAGLPVTLINNKLYPCFNSYERYDGRMYYQMNGCWLNYDFQVFNKDNCLVEGGCTDTYRDIRTVATQCDLLRIPYEELNENMIVKVLSDNSSQVALQGTRDYNIYNDNDGKGKYIYLTSNVDTFNIKDSWNGEYLETLDTDNKHYIASGLPDGTVIKYYLDDNAILFDNDVNNDSLNSAYYRYNSLPNSYNTCHNWTKLSENEEKALNKIITNLKGNNPHNPNQSYDEGQEYYNRFYQLFKYPIENNLFDQTCFGSYARYVYERDNIISGLGFDTFNETKYNIIRYDNGNFEVIDNVEDAFKTMPTKKVELDFSKLFGKFNNDSFKKYFLSVIMKYAEQFLPSTNIIKIVI